MTRAAAILTATTERFTTVVLCITAAVVTHTIIAVACLRLGLLTLERSILLERRTWYTPTLQARLPQRSTVHALPAIPSCDPGALCR